MFDGLSFDPFALSDDGCSPSEVGIGRRYVVQAFMVALVVVVLDEGLDLNLVVAGQEVVLQQDAVLERLMPPLDLALGLRVERRTAHMAHALSFGIFRQFSGDVAGPVVAEQSRLVAHPRRRLGTGDDARLDNARDRSLPQATPHASVTRSFQARSPAATPHPSIPLCF